MTNQEIQNKGLQWIDGLVKNHPDDLRQIIKNTTGHDASFASNSALRKIILDEIKAQNATFINELAKAGAAEVNAKKSAKRGEKKLNAIGKTQAEKDLESKINALKAKIAASKNAEEKEEFKAELVPLEKELLKLQSDKYTVGEGIGDAAKIAQSIFFLGSIFQKNDQPPIPNIQDDESAVRAAKQKTAMNIAIIVAVVAVVIVAAVLLLKRKPSTSN